jgi:hypothetical protein
MTRGRRTASQINEQKWKRMRLILDKLKEKNPMSGDEIEQLICGKSQADKIVKRSVQNYLAELRALGLIVHDLKAGIYQLAESKKVFQSKHDYEIALNHSRRLVLSRKDSQRLDQMSPNAALDLLVFGRARALGSERDVDNECLVQHLRTGYYREVYALMERYRQLMDETGLSKIPSIPKFSLSGLTWAEQSHMVGVEENISERDLARALFEDAKTAANKIRIQVNPFPSTDTPEYVYVTKTKMQEIIDLRDLLIGRIYSTAKDVVNGIPLQGYCKHCPDLKITILDKK